MRTFKERSRGNIHRSKVIIEGGDHIMMPRCMRKTRKLALKKFSTNHFGYRYHATDKEIGKEISTHPSPKTLVF
jgi:hypothetical protein